MKEMKVIRIRNRRRRDTKKKVIRILLLVAAVIVAVAVIWGGVCLIQSIDFGGHNEPCVIENKKNTTLIMNVGDKQVFTVDASDSVMDQLQFVSSDESVLTVDSGGRVDAKKQGQATITAKCDDFLGKCTVTVNKAPVTEKTTEYTTAIVTNLDVLNKNKVNTSKNPYSVTINRRTNTVTVYTYDSNGDYVIPVRAMVCSCGEQTKGNETILGVFSVYFKEKWHPLFGDVYGQYVTGFSGPYLFHSVPYAKASANTLKTEEFNKLSTHASQGCIRLMIADAKWVYDNLALGTVVEVVDEDESFDVLGRPKTIKIPNDVKWDPTDPHKYNPYGKKAPIINGAKDMTISVGDEYSPKVTALDTCSNDISDSIEVIGNVITSKKGTYLVTYKVTDDLKKTKEITVTITVE